MNELNLLIAMALGALAWVGAIHALGPHDDSTDVLLPAALAFGAVMYAWLRWSPL